MFYERSLGATGTIGYDPARPNQLVSASGVTAAYDETGNLGELRVSRAAGSCPTGSSSFCGQQYRYDWDEVGQLQRARRWDYTRSVPAGNPAYPGVPTAQPIVDVTFSYSGGLRVLKQSADALGPMYSLEVFDSLRVNRTRLRDGEYERNARSEVGYLAGLGKVIHSTTLPSPSGNPRHVLLTLGDQLGSATVVIDRESSEVVEKVTYMSYGAVESDYRPSRWQQQREEYKYTGKEEDIDIGLVYFGARYYHPRLGRFISADPLTIHAGGANANPYAYVSGRVYTHTDPWGFDEHGPVEQPKHPEPIGETGPSAPVETVIVVGDRGDREGNGPVYFVPGPRADGIWAYARALHNNLRQAAVRGGEHAKDTAGYAKSAASAELGIAAGIAADDARWLLDHTEHFEIGASVGALVFGSLGVAGGVGEGGALGLAGGPAAEVTVPMGAIAGAIVEGTAGAALGHEIGGNAEKALRILASKGGGGTPKDAQKAVARGQGPADIKRIDRPEQSVKGSQWHAHQTKTVNGKNPALNQDGSSHDGQPSFSARTLQWLQSFGWNIGK
jgi:RHS repeat-associated protein